MKQFKAEPYPFRFYCNAAGDLFLPPREEGGESVDLQDMTELPYPLQALYERFWSEMYGWLTYLVEFDGQYGLMLEQEFAADGSDPNYTEEMAVLYKEASSLGERIEKCFEKFCPHAIVLIGKRSGFDDCHELCVFVPAGSSQSEIKDMLYILSLADLRKPLPTVKGELYSENYYRYMEQKNYFSTLWGINKWYADKPTVTLDFSEGSEEDTLTVRVVKSFLEVDGAYAPSVTQARLQEAIEKILTAARKAGENPAFDTLVTRACNTLFPGAWEFPSPACTVYIDRDGSRSHSTFCPRCGAQLLKFNETENGALKIELCCMDCGYTSVHVEEDGDFTETVHCDGFGVCTIVSKKFGTMQDYFDEQLSKEEALEHYHKRLEEIGENVISSTLTWWNPEKKQLEVLEDKENA